MKKLLYMFGAILAIAGCAKEIEVPSVETPITSIKKEATIFANVNNTKSTLNNLAHVWENGDQIGVVENSSLGGLVEEFSYTGNNNEFSGSVLDGNYIYAVSPLYCLDSGSDERSFIVDLGVVNGYVPGQVNPILFAGAPDENDITDIDNETKKASFTFYHATALIKFTFIKAPKGTASLKFTTKGLKIDDNWMFESEDNFASTEYIDIAAQPDDNAEALHSIYVNLDPSEYVTSDEGKTLEFYVAVPTGNYSGFTVSLLNSSDEELFSTSTSINLNLQRGSYLVTPEIMVPTTVTKTISAIASENSWANTIQYSEWGLDDVVTISASTKGNNGKYYDNGKNWRLYHSDNGTMTVSVNSNYHLKSVKITYSNNNSGYLTDVDDESVLSDSKYSISDKSTSVTFTVSGGADDKDNGQVLVTAISVTYVKNAPDKPHTVTLNVGSGSCDVSSISETSASAGVTLPTPIPITGWIFAGWSTTSCTATTTSPDFVTMSDGIYYPTENITLYAVYSKTVFGGVSNKYAVTTELTPGNYVLGAVKAAKSTMLANNTQIGAITFSSLDSWGSYTDMTPDKDGVITTTDASATWTLSGDNTNGYILKKGDSYLYLTAETGKNTAGTSDEEHKIFVESKTSDCKDAFLIHPTSSSKNKLLLNTAANMGYRMYASTQNESASMCPYIRFYKHQAASTTTYYNSNPE